jgi:hypothetical protein
MCLRDHTEKAQSAAQLGFFIGGGCQMPHNLLKPSRYDRLRLVICRAAKAAKMKLSSYFFTRGFIMRLA